jgi:hypothetical protein
VVGEVERILRAVDEICEKLEELCIGFCSERIWDDYVLYRLCRLIVEAGENLREAGGLMREYLSCAGQQGENSVGEQLSLF